MKVTSLIESLIESGAVLVLLAQFAAAQTPFAPFDAWKGAVLEGNASSLSRLYSANPEAFTQMDKTRVALKDEIQYWAGMKSGGTTDFTPRILEMSEVKGGTRLVLRISTVAGGLHLVTSAQQVWMKQPEGWKIVASQRHQFESESARRLPQPPAPNVNLYSDPKEGEAELKAGLARAAKEKKRVIVVFGGNWCYDCHVLDTTFHSKDFAPLVDSNFVVIHINVGDEGKDNAALGARLGVALDKGVPSLGVLEANGTVVYAQKNGEFESTVKIGPEDVRAFLEKWKPRRG